MNKINKKLLKVAKLISLKTVLITDKKQSIYKKKLVPILNGYNDILLNSLKNVGFFSTVKNSAVYFKERNQDLLNTEKSEQLKKDAYKDIEIYAKSLLSTANSIINQERDLFKVLFKSLVELYNINAYSHIISVLIQSRLFSKKKKKAFDDPAEIDDTLNFFSLDAELYESLNQDFDFEFDLQDKQIINILEKKATEISYLTDMAFFTIYNILYTNFYLNNNSIETAISEIKTALDNYAETRTNFISQYNANIANSMSAKDIAVKMNITWKHWQTMNDERVRLQHSLNQYGGPRNINDSFAGGNQEFSPVECESPWYCRCTLLLSPSEDAPITMVWDGNSFFKI